MDIKVDYNIELNEEQQQSLDIYIKNIKDNGLSDEELGYIELVGINPKGIKTTGITEVRTTETTEVFVTEASMQTLCFAKAIKLDERLNITSLKISNLTIIDY